jgi:hypothetical protein
MNGLSSEKRQQIETLLRAGLSDQDVHRETGADRGTVARYRKRIGLPGHKAREDSATCRHGHPYPENAVRGSDGWLRCRTCMRASSRNAQRKPRAGTAVRQAVRPAAVRQGHAPVQPDPVAVARAVAGDPPARLTPRERRAAIRQLDAWQLPAAVIAERVSCSPRTVHRARSRQQAA